MRLHFFFYVFNRIATEGSSCFAVTPTIKKLSRFYWLCRSNWPRLPSSDRIDRFCGTAAILSSSSLLFSLSWRQEILRSISTPLANSSPGVAEFVLFVCLFVCLFFNFFFNRRMATQFRVEATRYRRSDGRRRWSSHDSRNPDYFPAESRKGDRPSVSHRPAVPSSAYSGHQVTPLKPSDAAATPWMRNGLEKKNEQKKKETRRSEPVRKWAAS